MPALLEILGGLGVIAVLCVGAYVLADRLTIRKSSPKPETPPKEPNP